MYFRNCGLRNTWLYNCLECPVSEDLSTGNTVIRPKHCSSLNDSTFTIYINHCESLSDMQNLKIIY